jgi:hypothetical protein
MSRKRIAAAVVALVALTGCTNQEIAAWIAWHDEAPEAAQVWLQREEVQASLTQDWDHDGIIEAEPPPPAPEQRQASTSQASTGNRCTGIIDALSAQSPGWDVNRMAAIAYRESRCQPSAANSCCTGLFQIHQIWIPKAGSCGVYSRADLTDPSRNICVAALIYRSQGMAAWSL